MNRIYKWILGVLLVLALSACSDWFRTPPDAWPRYPTRIYGGGSFDPKEFLVFKDEPRVSCTKNKVWARGVFSRKSIVKIVDVKVRVTIFDNAKRIIASGTADVEVSPPYYEDAVVPGGLFSIELRDPGCKIASYTVEVVEARWED